MEIVQKLPLDILQTYIFKELKSILFYNIHMELRIKCAITRKSKEELCFDIRDEYITKKYRTKYLGFEITIPIQVLEEIKLDADREYTLKLPINCCYMMYIPYHTGPKNEDFSDLIIFFKKINYSVLCLHHFLEDITIDYSTIELEFGS